MTDTLHLALPLVAAAQAQKHVTHNEALRSLDALVMLSVLDRDLTAPPGSPAEGARYLVKATGTGGFAGKDNQIAHFRDGVWAFHLPRAGWIAHVADEGTLIVHDGGAWQPLLGATPALQNLSRLGLATTADATNPLSAVLNNALFAARTVSNGGDGDLHCKLSKESASDTVSLLLQDNFSGRAEIGLTGDDDLHLKVSSDGSTWRDGLVIAAATGKVSFPQGAAGVRERLAAARTYYVRTDGNDANDGLTNASGGAFLTVQKAVDVAFGSLDLAAYNVTIQVADGSYSAGGIATAPRLGIGTVTIQGNAAHPENVVVDVNGSLPNTQACFLADYGARLIVKDIELRTSGSLHCLMSRHGSTISYSNIRFGACAGAHARAEHGASIDCDGNYSIVGNSGMHWSTAFGGAIRVQSRTITLSGTPAFSIAFAHGLLGGAIAVNGNTFSGSATGLRYSLATNAVINTSGGGASYLPGDVAGSAASGGQYA